MTVPVRQRARADEWLDTRKSWKSRAFSCTLQRWELQYC
jgi:hypothetical protein